MAIERALISVYDKTGVAEFARELAALGIEIISTGGTARLLREAGIPVRDVAELTGWPEMLGGRVKTLHPKVHGAILFQRGKTEDRKQAAEHGIVPIDLVVVNLYPFSATAAKPGVTTEELIENIDIGGPAMVRSAAKNFQSVGVVTEPGDYAAIARELRDNRELSLATRLTLARKAYAHTARYDGEIATELERLTANGSVTLGTLDKLPERIHIALERQQPMRYGENPHQAAAFLQQSGGPRCSLGALAGIPAPGREHHQAQQSVRHRGAADASRGVLESARVRSHFRIWRGAGVQSRARRGHGRRSGEIIRGMHRGARIRTRSARKVRSEEKSAAAGNAAQPGAR